MAGFPTFTPRTANTAAIWKDVNPAASFLGGMKAVRQMNLDDAAEQRLRESAEMDRLVKTSMLPLEMEKARADIDLTMAQKAYALSRARNVADTAGAAAMLEGLSGASDADLEKMFGFSAEETGARAVSPESGGGGSSILDLSVPGGGQNSVLDVPAGGEQNFEFNFSGPLSQFAPSEDRGPLYDLPENKVLLADNSGFGVADTGQTLSGMTKLEAMTPKAKVTNLADWDEDPATVAPLEEKNPLTSLQVPEGKRREIQALNEQAGGVLGQQQNPQQQQQQRPREEGVGAYLVGQIGKIQSVADKSKALKGAERSLYLAGSEELQQRTYANTAKMLGMAPGLGEFAANTLAYGKNGAQRSPGQINEIVSLFKNGADLRDAAAIVDGKAEQRLKAMLGEGAESDIVGEINKINTAVKSISDEYGNALRGKEAELDSLNARKDSLLKLPTGVSRYSDRLSRLEDREARMNNAVVAGVGYGEISKENLPQEIAKLKQQQVTLAVDNAPYFKDREALKSWASDKNTRPLPFFTDVNGARVLARMSDDPNVLSVWAPTQNDWIPLDLNKKEVPAETTAETKTTNPNEAGKKINEAGKKLNKLTAPITDLTSRYTPEEFFEKARDRAVDAGLNIGDYLATGVRNNVLAPALEFSAGASGKELDLEDLPNPSFKDRKWKNLTSKERAALLGRSSPGLTAVEAALKAK